MELCGHATLAAAYVLFEEMGFAGEQVVFNTLHKGPLTVKRDGKAFEMTFPKLQPEVVNEVPAGITQGLGVDVEEVLASDDYLVVLPSEDDVLNVNPDFNALAQLDRRG